MDVTKNNKFYIGLTATEVSNIWSSYLKNNMELRFLEYFLVTTEDIDIKKIIESMLLFSEKNLSKNMEIFKKENLAIPNGFKKEDVRVDAKKVFSDTFISYFLYDISQLSLSTYSSAISDCTNKDVRNYFQSSIEFTLKIQNDILHLMLNQGIYLKPPQVAIEKKIDSVDSITYLNGLLGNTRTINTAEIANLTRIIHRAQFSKMVFVAFSKLTQSKDLKQHFSNGRDEIEKVLDSLQEILEKENVPISASGDYNIFDVEVPPFSDKLMLFFINTCIGLFCFIMINQALTSSLRSDITSKFTKVSKDMKKFYEDGLMLMIKEQWLEEPPQIVDRKLP